MFYRKDYQKALELRLQGKTYGEIRSVFGVPKSTQSGWFKNLKLSQAAKKILDSKQKEGIVALGEFNKRRTIAIEEENEKIRKSFQDQVAALTRRELMFIGAALYWGEGQKYFSKYHGGYPLINFSNSDPSMVTVFLSFLRNILNVDENKLIGAVMIHPGIDKDRPLKYWGGISNIKRLRCYVALSSASQRKRPPNLLPHGTFQIRLCSRKEFFKIKGLIDGIVKSIII